MAATSVFALTRFTALASGDVIAVVDISDTSQSAHGSLDAITVANFFASVPVPIIVVSSSAVALAVGPTGAVAPVLLVNASTGRVGIGTASPLAPLHIGSGTTLGSADAQVAIIRNMDDASGTGNGHAFSDSSVVTRSGTIGYNSMDCRITVAGTADYDHLAGFQFLPAIGTSGTVAKYYGFISIPQVTAGTVTDGFALYAGNPTGAGALTNNYGLYVEAMAKGGTLNYAIYTNAGLVRFGDGVTIASGGLTVSAGTSAFQAVTAAANVTINNGFAFAAKRNTGASTINVLSFATGTDNLELRTGGADGTTNFTIKNTSNTALLTLTNAGQLSLGGPLQLSNAYTAGAPAAAGYVTVKDSTGTTYKLLAAA